MKTLIKVLPALLAIFILSACAPVQRHHQVRAQPQPTPPSQVATEIYFYPNHGQSIKRQDRDRFECYLWAKQQTGFDPSVPHLAPHQRTYIVPQPAPGHDTAAGAFTGAVLGALIGSPGRTGEGAAIGALAGAALGAASDAARQEQAEHIQERYDQQYRKSHGALDRQARKYRRAMSACLDGRGYTVR